jgi:glutathione synthase/RimK-type ligase-like ATP-grasp enzyme
VQRRYGIPRTRQMSDIVYYKWRLGAGRFSYYGFQLFRPDLDDAARSQFLTQAAWNVLVHRINPQGALMDRSKLWQARRFAEAGIPAPRTLGYTAVEPKPRQRGMPEFVPLADLPRVVPSNGFVIKPDHSKCGLGVLVFKQSDGGTLHRVDGEVFTLDRLAAALRQHGRSGYLVQERLENHPDMAALGVPSLATVRVVTYGSPDDMRVPRAAVKLPVGSSGVDNYHAGAVAAPIDVSSGRIGAGVDSEGMEWLSCHPESGVRFEGAVVPLWSEVLTQARRAAAAVPECRTVGWDIAVTPDGVRIIEGNAAWGTNIVQRPHRAGIWEGEFRQWSLDVVGDAKLPRTARRWLGLP